MTQGEFNLQGLQMGNSYSCWKLLHLVLLVGLDNGQVVSELGECWEDYQYFVGERAEKDVKVEY